MTVTPKKVSDIMWGFAQTRALTAAVELDVFTHIANGKHTLNEIASASDCSLRGMGMLLDALVGLKLLIKDKRGSYYLARNCEKFLVSGRPTYFGEMLLHRKSLDEAWSGLTESVKTGRPYAGILEKRKGEDFFPGLVKGLFSMNYQAARYAAAYLKRKKKNISHILDVAAGSGVWGIAFAQEFPLAKLTAIDFLSVCGIAHNYINKYKLSDRFECIGGDLRAIDFGKERFDLVILGHICHSEGENNTLKLLKKSYNALNFGGDLLIAEFLPNDNKTAPLIPLLFGLNMLVNTDEGCVFTLRQFRQWLRDIGFKKIDILKQAPSLSPLILAIK